MKNLDSVKKSQFFIPVCRLSVKKIISQMDMLTSDFDVNVSIKDNNVSIKDSNVSIKQEDVSIEDAIVIRKIQILEKLKSDPKTTVEMLKTELSVTDRTIYRDIEWLKENGYLERLGSSKSGLWHVIKDL